MVQGLSVVAAMIRVRLRAHRARALTSSAESGALMNHLLDISSASALIDSLSALVGEESVAGLSITSSFHAVGPTVTPPAGTVDGDAQGLFELPDGRRAATLDSWGSQARRWSIALSRNADTLGLPRIRLTATRDDEVVLDSDSYLWSHRHVDAVFRSNAAAVDRAFVEAGLPDRYRDIAYATSQDADALLRWFPQSLICGWWDSHTGKAAAGAKATATALKLPEPGAFVPNSIGARTARAMSSEILAKGVSLRTRYAARVDPIFGAMPTKGKSAGAKISSLGFGSIPPIAAPKDVTFEAIEGTTWLSFTMLRRLGFAEPDRARSALVVLALTGIELSSRDLHLRSGTDLILDAREASLEIHGAGRVAISLPSREVLMEATRLLSGELGWSTLTVDLSDSKNLHRLLALSAQEQEQEQDKVQDA